MGERSWWCVVGLVVSAVGCGGDEAQTKTGGSTDVYGAAVQTYAVVDGDLVTEVGFTFPKAAATGGAAQPAGTVDGWFVEFPPEVKAQTVVDHFLLDFFHDGIAAPWDEGFFGVHFYFRPQPSRIAVTCPETAPSNADFVPAQYLMLDTCTFGTGATCGCIEGEGLHAIDLAAPEMQDPPGRFTHNFWLGYNGGTMAFFEPFITTAMFMGSTGFEQTIRQPAAYPPGTSGKLFPQRLSMTLDGETWSVALSDFITIP